MPRTPGFDALGFAFQISADDPALIDELTWLFHCLAPVESTADEYSLRPRRTDRSSPVYEIRLGQDHVANVATREQIGSALVHDVTRRALSTTRHLVLHAGGVEHRGIGTAFPGAAEAGKSTLVAGLVRAGLAYLTDEALAVDRDTMQIEPFPKPLSIDPGAWALFPELVACGALPTDARGDQWQVAPDAIRAGSVGRAAPIAFVVFPRYSAGTAARLDAITRGEALVEAAKHTFGLRTRARENLDLLAAVMRGAACYRLTTGGLEPAVELITGLLGADDLRERA